MYENVLKNIIRVTNGIWVSFVMPYIDIRIMEDIGSCDDIKINSYSWLK